MGANLPPAQNLAALRLLIDDVTRQGQSIMARLLLEEVVQHSFAFESEESGG